MHHPRTRTQSRTVTSRTPLRSQLAKLALRHLLCETLERRDAPGALLPAPGEWLLQALEISSELPSHSFPDGTPFFSKAPKVSSITIRNPESNTRSPTPILNLNSWNIASRTQPSSMDSVRRESPISNPWQANTTSNQSPSLLERFLSSTTRANEPVSEYSRVLSLYPFEPIPTSGTGGGGSGSVREELHPSARDATSPADVIPHRNSPLQDGGGGGSVEHVPTTDLPDAASSASSETNDLPGGSLRAGEPQSTNLSRTSSLSNSVVYDSSNPSEPMVAPSAPIASNPLDQPGRFQRDGNRDGVWDSDQPNVAHLEIPTQNTYLTLTSDHGFIRNLSQQPVFHSQQESLLPFGLIGFEIVNVPVGSIVHTQIHLPESSKQLDRYWKQDSQGTLVDFEYDGFTGAILREGAIDLYLQDGGRGDRDGIANGTILDPGGPGTTPLPLSNLPLSTWKFTEYGGTENHRASFVDGKLIEGDSFLSELSIPLVIASNTNAIQFRFRTRFDNDGTGIRDAFEAAFIDSEGLPLVPTFSTRQDSFLNVSEGIDSAAGATTTVRWSRVRDMLQGDVLLDLTHVPAETVGTLRFRLINNDNQNRADNTSFVRFLLGNTAPVARDDFYTTDEDARLVTAAPGILGNDEDFEEDILQAKLLSPPSHGHLSMQTDGSFDYSPHKNFYGTDTFVYQVGDGITFSAPATATLHVAAVNDSPIGIQDNYTLRSDLAFEASLAQGVLANDFDFEQSPLAASLVTEPGSGPHHGSVDLQSDGSFRYTPTPNYHGNDSFRYVLSDGTSTSQPIEVVLRVVPRVTSVYADSTTWSSLFPFSTEGYTIDSTIPKLPWFRINQLRVQFSEDIATIRPQDIQLVGSSSLGIDYGRGLQIEQPDPRSLMVTLRPDLYFTTDTIQLSLLETVHDRDGNAIDGNGDGATGDPYNLRFDIVRGDTNGDGFVLSNDVALVRDSQFGVGVYRPFADLNGNGFILGDDVSLARDNQFGLPQADRAWFTLAAPTVATSPRSVTKFYVADRDDSDVYRYESQGSGIRNLSTDPSTTTSITGLAATASGEKLWMLESNGEISIADTATGYTLGKWRATDVVSGQGISIWQNDAWIVDSQSDTVRLYRQGARWLTGLQSADTSFALHATNTNPTGIVSNGTHLWVTDSIVDQVFVYTRDGQFLGAWGLDADNQDVTGITLNPAGGEELWTVDASNPKIFVYENAQSWINGERNAIRQLDLHPSNTSPSDIADPPTLRLDPIAEAYPANTTILISGQTDAGARIRLESAPAPIVDSAGNFFGNVTVGEGIQPISITSEVANEESRASLSVRGIGSNGSSQNDFTITTPEALGPLGITPRYGITSFREERSILSTQLALEHRGSYPLRAPMAIGVRNLSRQDVRLRNADGRVDGIAYIDVSDSFQDSDSAFLPNSESPTWEIQFDNPSREPFTFEWVLLSHPNAAPEFTTIPVVHARVGNDFVYPASAWDRESDPINFRIDEGPLGMTIDASSGLVQWNNLVETGTFAVRIIATDSFGSSESQQWVLQVSPSQRNHPPKITSEPLTGARVNTTYNYDVLATDVDEDPITYSLVAAPMGMSIDPLTGRVGWKPTDEQLGLHSITVRATDNQSPSLYVDQSYSLRVAKEPGNGDPVIVSLPSTILNQQSSGPSTGPVWPSQPIILSLNDGESIARTVQFTRNSSLPQADVLFLLDDTASMDVWGESLSPIQPTLLTTFQNAIDSLDAAYPSTDFAFGFARMENYALSSDSIDGFNRPFILNQPVLRKEDPGFTRFVEQALNRRAPGTGAGTVSLFEALYQAATGVGLDYGSNDGLGVGPVNGTPLDNGHSLDIRSQTQVTYNGDVAPFNTPRSLRYRILRANDFPALNSNETVSGTIQQPFGATGWSLSVPSTTSRLRIMPTAIANANWLLMDPVGVQLYRGPANIPFESDLTAIGDYRLVLDSQSNQPLDFVFTASLLDSKPTPLAFHTPTTGAIFASQQIERYRFSIDDWSSIYMDVQSVSPDLQWSLYGPDGNEVTRGDFSNATLQSPVATQSGDQWHRLPRGEYRLEVSGSSESGSVPPNTPYRFALHPLTVSSAPPALSNNASLLIHHTSDRGGIAKIYPFQTFYEGQEITIQLPALSANENTVWTLVDTAGNRLYQYSTYPNATNSSSHTVRLSQPGTYMVQWDSNINRSAPVDSTLTLLSGNATPNVLGTPIELDTPVQGSLPSRGGTVSYALNLSDHTDTFFDAWTLTPNIHWELFAPSGHLIADSRMDATLPTRSDSVLAGRPYPLAPGNYRLQLTNRGLSTTPFHFVARDMAGAPSLPFGVDVDSGSQPAESAWIYRVSSEQSIPHSILRYYDFEASMMAIYNPRLVPIEDWQSSGEHSYVSTVWPAGTTQTDFYLVIDNHQQPHGTPLFHAEKGERQAYALPESTWNHAEFVNLSANNAGTQHDYSFHLSTPARAYFEPAPEYLNADADWTLIGPEGTVVDRLRFDQSGSRASDEGTNSWWLREGEYTLRIQSRIPQVAFRFASLESAGELLEDSTISGTPTDGRVGSRFHRFTGKQGDYVQIRLTEPTSGGSSGLLRARIVDPFGQTIAVRSVPGPRFGQPSPGFVDIAFDLPVTGRYSVIVENIGGGSLSRPYSLQLRELSSYPSSQSSTLDYGQVRSIEVDSSVLLYDSTMVIPSTDFVFFDELTNQGTFTTQITLATSTGGRNVSSSSYQQDLFRWDTGAPILVQSYTNSVPTTPGGSLGGAGFRPGSVPIFVVVSDTWSDVRPRDEIGKSQPTEIVGYGESILPQDHLSGAYLNPIANPAEANSFLHPDAGGLIGNLRYRNLNLFGPPLARILPPSKVRSSEATIQQTMESLTNLGAYVLPVFFDYTNSFDNASDLTLHRSWYDLPNAIARLTGSINQSDRTLASGDSQTPIEPGSPMTFYFNGYGSPEQATQLTHAVSQLLEFGKLDVDILASDPSVQIQVSGVGENIAPGEQATFTVTFTGDGTPRSFDLLFVRKGTGNIVGSIPVQIVQPYRYDIDAIDPDRDEVLYSLVGNTHDATVNPRTGELTWTPTSPGRYTFQASVSDGRGGRDHQTWEVVVGTNLLIPDNGIPLLEPITADWSAYVGRTFVYQAVATDPDNDPLSYYLQPSDVRSSIPEGLTIDRKTGEIQWTPRTATKGTVTARVGVRDAKGAVASQIVRMKAIVPPISFNSPPTIVPIPEQSVPLGTEFRYRVQGNDPQGDAIVFSLALGRERGAVLDPKTDTIHWTPKPEDIGIVEMIVAASDPSGATSTHKFRIRVLPTNLPPVFRDGPTPGPIQSSLDYQHTVSAFDPEGQTITFSLVNTGLQAASVDPVNGVFRWRPGVNPLGSNRITIRATDDMGAFSDYSWDVLVTQSENPNRLPYFVTSPREQLRPGTPWSYPFEAFDPDGNPIIYSVDTFAGIEFDAEKNILRWNDPLPGTPPTIRVMAWDGFGTNTQTLHLTVTWDERNDPPRIVSYPNSSIANLGKTWVYDVQAIDAENDPIGFSFDRVPPRGMFIDPKTGIIRWTPEEADLGETAIVYVSATDILGNRDTQILPLRIVESDLPPVFDSMPVVDSSSPGEYVYPVQAHDPEGMPIAYALLNGPVGTTISEDGIVRWTVPSGFVTPALMEIQISTGLGPATARQRYFVQPSPRGSDQPPSIVSTPLKISTVGDRFEYQVVAVDPDSPASALSYSLVASPRVAGIASATPMTMTPSGLVQWTPVAGHLAPGIETVEIAVTSDGKTAKQRFAIAIEASNSEPLMVAPPILDVVLGQVYSVDLSVRDSDGDAIRFELTDAPSGMVLDPLGRVRWSTSTATPLGVFEYTVLATDNRGAPESAQTFALRVVPDQAGPSIAMQIHPQPSFVHESSRFIIDAFDISNVVRYSLTAQRWSSDSLVGSPISIPVNAAGLASYSFDEVGSYRILATATDSFGNPSSITRDLMVGDRSGSPRVSIASPIANANVLSMEDVVGSVEDSDLASWSLLVLDRSGNHLRTIVSQSQEQKPAGSILGILDSTMLPFSEVVLRLQATDILGKTSTADRVVNTSGGIKLGNLRLEFEDMSLPFMGMPISVKRVYDTLEANRMGDFGYGWNLEFSRAKFTVDSETLGQGQGSTRFEPFIDGSRVTVTLPNGKQESFTFKPRVRATLPIGGDVLTYTPAFEPDEGNTAALGVPQNVLNRVGGGDVYRVGDLPDNDSYSPIDPDIAGYLVLQLPDGTRHFMNGETGETYKITDKNGNELRYTEEGIQTSLARSISIQRDTRGRISAITDPVGNSLSYSYDDHDRLIGFQDRNQTQKRLLNVENRGTEYRYRTEKDYENYLDSIIDPYRTTSLTAEYDLSSGRVESLSDAMGNKTETRFELTRPSPSKPDGQFVVQTYAPGETPNAPNAVKSSVTLNQRGHVLSTESRAGAKSTYEYKSPLPVPTETREIIGLDDRLSDEQNDLITRTEFGFSREFSYSFAAIKTDTYGNVTRDTFDNSGQLIASTDAMGNSTLYQYDRKAGFEPEYGLPTRGNIKHVIDPNGNSTLVDYQPQTGLTDRVRTVLRGGDIETVPSARIVYDANGSVLAAIAPDNITITVRENANGFKQSNSTLWKDPNDASQSKQLENRHLFDANDNPIGVETRTEGTLQHRSETQFDALSRPALASNATGLRSETIYDTRGLAIEQRSETDLLGIDPTTGTQERVWEATRSVYDQEGRLIAQAIGIRMLATGLMLTAISETHGTQKIYNSKGQLVEDREVRNVDIRIEGTLHRTSRLNNSPTILSRSQTEFDTNDRPVRSTEKYGNVTESIFDRFGNGIETREQTYNEAGSSLWLVRRTVVDSHGRVIASSDPYTVPTSTPLGKDGGNSPPVYATFTTYDSRGQVIRTSRQQNVIFGWTDDSKQLLTAIIQPGETMSSTSNRYDAQGRLYERTDSYGQKTTTLYDERSRVVAKLDTPVAASSIGLVGSEYANTLVRHRTETRYDSNGKPFQLARNIRQVEDLSGQLLRIDRNDEQIEERVYDERGRVVQTIAADGAVSTQIYDVVDRLVGEISPIGHQKDYVYDGDGRLRQVALPAVMDPNQSGSPLTRPVTTYGYDSHGQLNAIVDAMGRVTRFTYDNLGQKTSRTLPSGGTEYFQYDLDRRQTLQISFEGVHKRSVYDDSRIGKGRLYKEQYFSTAEDYRSYKETGELPSDVAWEEVSLGFDSFGRIVSTTHAFLLGASKGIPIQRVRTDQWRDTFDGEGRITRSEGPIGFIEYGYDSLGRKVSIKTGDETSPRLTENRNSYNASGQLDLVETLVRDGVLVDLDSASAGSQPERTKYHYDLQRRIDFTELPNGLVEDLQYDSGDRLDWVRHLRSDADNSILSDNAIISLFDYSYREDGVPIEMTEHWHLENEITNTYSWDYDASGRLTQETFLSSDETLGYVESFVLDLVGNRVARSIDRATSTDQFFEMTYDANDRLLREMQYDGLTETGNLRQSTQYTWRGSQPHQVSTAFSDGTSKQQRSIYGLSGRLAILETVSRDASSQPVEHLRSEYRYDRDGIRYLAIDSTHAPGGDSNGSPKQTTAYLSDKHNATGHAQTLLETLFDGNQQPIERITYVVGKDQISQTKSQLNAQGSVSQTSVLSLAHDGKGSTRLTIASDSQLVEGYRYTAYGELSAIYDYRGLLYPASTANQVKLESIASTRLLYNGEYYQEGAEAYYLRARWYDPTTGRFDRLDPFAGDPQNPFSFHKYGFTHGNPHLFNDPTGMFEGLSGLLSGIAVRVQSMSITSFVMQSALAYTIANWSGSTEPLAKLTPEQKVQTLKYADLAVGSYLASGENGDFDKLLQQGWRRTDSVTRQWTGYRNILMRHSVTNELVLSFAGTDDIPDIFIDILQGLFGGTSQYRRAASDVKDFEQTYGRIDHITGHSLGGGLASLASLVSRRRATTFNAAGLNSRTSALFNVHNEDAYFLSHAFRVQGEFLSSFQDVSPVRNPILLPLMYASPIVLLLGVTGILMPNGLGKPFWLAPTSFDSFSRHKMASDVIPGIKKA